MTGDYPQAPRHQETMSSLTESNSNDITEFVAKNIIIHNAPSIVQAHITIILFIYLFCLCGNMEVICVFAMHYFIVCYVNKD